MRNVSAIALLALAGAAGASPSVRVTTLVNPPYSTYLTDYVTQPGRLLLKLQNLTSAELRVRLLVKVYCPERHIRIVTDSSYKPQRAIVLPAGQMTDIRVQDLSGCFSAGRVLYEGVTLGDMMRGNGLPQGRYQICVRALDYETGAPLSDPEPAGSSGFFDVVQYDPVAIVQPASGTQVLPTAPQSIVFAWLRPTGIAPSRVLEYRLRVVEIVPDVRDPGEALASTAPVFEKLLRNTTVYVYGPRDPLLRPGARYAARVDVRDVERAGGFRNGGQGEPIVFRFGSEPRPRPDTAETAAVRPRLLKVTDVRVLNLGKDTAIAEMAGEYAAQLFALPTDSADVVEFVFDGEPDIASVIAGQSLLVRTAQDKDVPGEVSSLPGLANAVRFRADAPFAGVYRVRLLGAGDCPVRSVDRFVLDGEPAALPSGDGNPGGDFRFELVVR
jgi:hypothetical protein